MRFAALHPRLFEALISAGILLGSYVAARLLSLLFAKVFARVAARTPSGVDDKLVQAWRRPVTYLLFLVGAYAAAHRLPVDARTLRYVDRVLFTAAVFLVTLAAMRGFSLFLEWYLARSRAAGSQALTAEFAPLFSKLGRVFITLVAVTVLLEHLGVNVSSLVVSLGVGSLAVGLAAQDTLANMFAGFTLMLDRPFRVGDRVQLASGEAGDVEAIGMRATRIRTGDETLLIVPNSVLVKERLVNLTQPTRSLTTKAEVSVGFGSDIPTVKQLLVDAALSCALVDEGRPPIALVQRFGDASVDLTVTFWVRDYLDQGVCRSQVLESIYRRLIDENIARPLPTRRIIHEGAVPEGAVPQAPEA
jgi:small-conductance mechanosensitive channel